MTLTEFLLARIAEDETVAEAAAAHAPGGEWRAYDPDEGTERAGRFGCVVTGGMHPTAWPQHAAHIARHDPARVLAECEAKRRIVADYAHLTTVPGHGAMASHSGWILRQLAAVYCDHPDYLPEWKP